MSYHIITVLQQGARLSVDRGFLVCQYPDGSENRMALADVRGVVVGVPSVAFTNTCIARLLAQDSPILHCNEQYKPIGWSVSLERVIRKDVFSNQLQQCSAHSKALWKQVVGQKMKNQANLLSHMGVEHHLDRLIRKPLANEANIARQYWGHYFELLGHKQVRERKGATSVENKALNYGYAVMSTLVHRAILMHGLLPSLGIHHEFRYRSYPLVYDLVEPFRGFVDLALVRWQQQQLMGGEIGEVQFSEWIRFFMNALQLCRIKLPGDKHSFKLMDAVDKSVASVASCFEQAAFETICFDKLWLPKLEHHYWMQDIAGSLEEDEENDLEQVG